MARIRSFIGLVCQFEEFLFCNRREHKRPGTRKWMERSFFCGGGVEEKRRARHSDLIGDVRVFSLSYSSSNECCCAFSGGER